MAYFNPPPGFIRINYPVIRWNYTNYQKQIINPLEQIKDSLPQWSLFDNPDYFGFYKKMEEEQVPKIQNNPIKILQNIPKINNIPKPKINNNIPNPKNNSVIFTDLNVVANPYIPGVEWSPVSSPLSSVRSSPVNSPRTSSPLSSNSNSPHISPRKHYSNNKKNNISIYTLKK
jgi:hypothetical protein